MRTFKQFLKESNIENLNESDWDEVYRVIYDAKTNLDDAEEMWNGASVQENYKNIIKSIENGIKNSQKALTLLKKYKK